MKDIQLLLFLICLRCTAGFFIGEPNFANGLHIRNSNEKASPNKNTLMLPTHQHSTNNGTTALTFAPSNIIHSSRQSAFQIYCDLDGVLVDFEEGVRRLTGEPTSNFRIKQTMWNHVIRANAFFENLSWTKDGPTLWNAIKHLKPDILTGCPSHESSRTEKFHWCQQQLGVDRLHHVDMASNYRDHQSVNGNWRQEGVTNVITCWSENKFRECTAAGSVLIDDTEDLRQSWERAGGLFVHHTDADNTIRQLQRYGIL